MNRNGGLYLLVGALAVVVIALSVQLSHERQSAPGITIALKDNGGISVDEKK